jgi:hypothetical protein
MISQETDNEEIEILYNKKYGGWTISDKAMELYKLRTTNNLDSYFHKRNDTILIQIFKELGNEFDDKKYSRTLIKKIPKKYEDYYYISEYDGLETVNIDYTKYELDNLKKNIKEILENNNFDNNEKINQFKKMIN